MRYPPLGSPTATPNWSYVHVPVSPYWSRSAAVCMSGCGRWVPGRVVYRGGWGGVVPSWCILVLPGPNHWLLPLFRVHPGTPAPAGPPHTWAPRAPVDLNIGRDSANNILKLVNNPECQQKCLMRPVILPVSKSRPYITTFNS